MALRNWLTSRPVKYSSLPARRPRLGVLALEDRTIPSATLVSSLGVENAVGPSQTRGVAADATGNSYVVGFFTGTVDFDPAHAHAGDTDILTSRGGDDIYVAKYTPDNTLVWAVRMGSPDPRGTDGAATDIGSTIAIDGTGNAYVSGWFVGTADFGATNLTSAGGRDGFVAKVNATGTVQWANRWGTTGNDYGSGVGVDAAGNVYALGSQLGAGNDVLKFGPTGSAIWDKWIATDTGSTSRALAVDAAGNVFVGGDFHGTVDFDPGPKTKYVTSGPSQDAFVLKLDTKGNFGWVSQFAGRTVGSTWGFSFAQSLALDGGGNVIVGGTYEGPVDFNPGSGTTILSTTGQAFIAKLNGSGGLVWAKAIEGNNYVFVYGLATDAAGSVYATGSIYGSADFDPGAGTFSRTTNGGIDAFVMKLDSAGNFAWADTFGSTGSDIGWGIAVDPIGTVYLAGAYQGNVAFDLDPTGLNGLTNPGTYYNGYLVKLTQPVTPAAGGSYPEGSDGGSTSGTPVDLTAADRSAAEPGIDWLAAVPGKAKGGRYAGWLSAAGD
jgi:hypothetical protein